MELGDKALDKLIKEKIENNLTWTPNECLSIMIQLVETVNEINKMGLYHCDLKPENVIFK